MTRVLVTGASGFVGRVLCDVLARSGYLVRGAFRSEHPLSPGVTERVVVGEIASTTDWTAALDGVDAVIHTAARAHVLYDGADNSRLYMETNALGTQRLADAAVLAGIGRFIYLSSVKVNGEETTDRAYKPEDEPHPIDAYGTSKWMGEKYLTQIAAHGRMETAIVRSPLVYGPGVRANFLRLLCWVDKEWPLPFGAIDNRRSLVSIWNLCDLLLRLLRSPCVSGRTWMVSDGEDLSTPELVRRIGRAMDRRVRLLPVSPVMLRFVGGLTGRRAEVARLCGSLVLDVVRTRAELGWVPPLPMDEALERTVSWYLAERQPLAR